MKDTERVKFWFLVVEDEEDIPGVTLDSFEKAKKKLKLLKASQPERKFKVFKCIESFECFEVEVKE